ncbi:DNA methyltransferase [Streptococcus sp. SPS1]|uniref:DNA methyltransferase n=1 Tax=Streptococcus sp. SPS1 TaxID=3018247 RepID=UPI00263CB91E|nr:DNA methyltransferase [Streptococcus sp. SPS1]MDN5026435.1 DNA methyltransferase [Streptococcus sp. SPS1]
MKVDCFYSRDSITGLKELPPNSIHAIVSDIPYGIDYADWDTIHSNSNKALGGSSDAQLKNSLFKRRGKPLNGWSEADRLRPLEYQKWVSTWAGEWVRIVKPGGSVFVFAGRQFSHRVIVAFEEAGFTFKDMLSWERDKAPQIVLDPFAGSATTLLAAKELNRKYIGYEKDFEIYKIGKERLNQSHFKI